MGRFQLVHSLEVEEEMTAKYVVDSIIVGTLTLRQLSVYVDTIARRCEHNEAKMLSEYLLAYRAVFAFRNVLKPADPDEPGSNMHQATLEYNAWLDLLDNTQKMVGYLYAQKVFPEIDHRQVITEIREGTL
jgi:hypothetical protein